MRRAAIVLSLLVTACSSASARPDELTVFAASSLTDALGELEPGFEEEARVGATTSFAGSHVLRAQIERGAPADVFVSADESHTEALVDAGLLVDVQTLAHNELVLIVPRENPAGIASFADLPRARRVVIGVPEVPVGRHTRTLLARAAASLGEQWRSDVLASVVSEESNARLVRAKVELGEADAAIVYRTDASDRVRSIEIDDELNVRADYTVGIVAASPRRALAQRWIDYARSDDGRRVLALHGFETHR